MKRVKRAPSMQSDRGAYAVLYAILTVAIVGFAALALDISMQLYRQQNLQNVIDAAVVAGSAQLDGKVVLGWGPVPRARTAVTDGKRPGLGGSGRPHVRPRRRLQRGRGRRCQEVGRGHGPGRRDEGLLPRIGGAPYSMAQCNSRQCAIPCLDEGTCKPNTIRLDGHSDVPYVFAPVIGITQGSTGGVVSVACKGGCGAQSGAPVDMVILGDRTPSMSNQERADEAAAITSALGQLDPSSVHVGLGMVGYSS